MRPYQAGLMGCDTLVLLDEAHLSRPFGRLLQAIEKEQQPAVPGGTHSSGRLAGPLAGAGVPPPFRVVPLSATLGTAVASSVPFGLCEEDRSNETVRARLDASKTLTVEDVGADVLLETVLAERACNLARRTPRESPVRMLVYCNSRSVAESVAENIRERVGTEAAVLLFVGGRRVYEREAAARELCRHGWLADGSQPDAPVFPRCDVRGRGGRRPRRRPHGLRPRDLGAHGAAARAGEPSRTRRRAHSCGRPRPDDQDAGGGCRPPARDEDVAEKPSSEGTRRSSGRAGGARRHRQVAGGHRQNHQGVRADATLPGADQAARRRLGDDLAARA